MIALMVFVGQVVIVQFGGRMFNVTPFSLADWFAIIASTSFVLWIGELVRLLCRKRRSL